MIFCLLHPKQNERAIRKTIAPNSKTIAGQSFCYAPNEDRGCVFSVRFLRGKLLLTYRRRWPAGKLQISGCKSRFAFGFCRNIKKRTETLYQSFSPFMVERRGFEPLTSTMRTLRATNCANAPYALSSRNYYSTGGRRMQGRRRCVAVLNFVFPPGAGSFTPACLTAAAKDVNIGFIKEAYIFPHRAT